MRVPHLRKAWVPIVFTICVLLSAQGAFAGVGLSPASVNFEKMVRGGYAERYLTVSNPTDEKVTVSVSVEGPIGGWVTAEPSPFNMSGIGYRIVKIIVRPPDSIPNGIYNGKLLIVSKPDIPPEELAGSMVSVASAVMAEATVEISDVQMMRYNVEKIQLPDTEECRPILVALNLRNTGNVNATPRFHVEITSRDGGTLLQEYDETTASMFPTTTAAVSLRVPYNIEQFKCIPVGDYSAGVTSYSGASTMDASKLDFTIHPRNSLTVGGEIIELKVPSNITLGEVAKIEALFKNTGQIPVAAKLNAEVYQGGRLVETVSGDAIEVYTGSVQPLVAYFTPKSGGKHTFAVSAAFEERKSEAVNAEMEVFWPSEYLIAAGVACAAVAAGTAIFLLKRKGNRKSKRGR